MKEVNQYTKAVVAGHVRRAHQLCRSSSIAAQHGAIREYQMATDRLLSLVYAKYRRRGIVGASIGTISLKARCEAVATWLEREGACSESVTAGQLTRLMSSYNALKHHLLPRVPVTQELLWAANSIVPKLFEYCFDGVSLFDNCGMPCVKEFPEGGDGEGVGCIFSSMLDEDEVNAFLTGKIRSRIEPLLTAEECELFELLDEWFIAGVVDSATLRRAKTFDKWFSFLHAGQMRFWDRLPDAVSVDLDGIFDAKAMEVLSDIKAFVRTEAWSVRLTSDANDMDTRSDEELALRSAVDRMTHWLDQRNEAA